LRQIRASRLQYIANVAPQELKAEVEAVVDYSGVPSAVGACPDLAETPDGNADANAHPPAA
jgi:hypothetical protein